MSEKKKKETKPKISKDGMLDKLSSLRLTIGTRNIVANELKSMEYSQETSAIEKEYRELKEEYKKLIKG